MIVCPGCSNESPDDSAFCGFCGHKFDARRPRKTLFAFKPILKDPTAAEADAGTPAPDAPGIAGGPKLSRRKPARAESAEKEDVETDWATLNLMSLPSLETIGSNRAQQSQQKAREKLAARADTERTEPVDARTLPHSGDAVAAVGEEPPTLDPREIASAADIEEGIAAGGEARLRSGVRDKVDRSAPSVVPDADLDDEARRAQAAEAAVRKADRNSTFVMEGPVGGDIPAAGADTADKEDEQQFFGASLSKHGMPAVEQDAAAERSRGLHPVVLLLIALVVIGAIVGVVLVVTG